MDEIVKQPSKRQKKSVDNILSGKFKDKGSAMRAAGYAKYSASHPNKNLAQRKGVATYLKTLGKVAKKRYNMNLRDKVMMTYLDGLDANKHVGKKAIEVPDHTTRKQFADQFGKFFGWYDVASQAPSSQQNQFNFFSVSDKKREDFNNNFKDFLDYFYKRKV